MAGISRELSRLAICLWKLDIRRDIGPAREWSTVIGENKLQTHLVEEGGIDVGELDIQVAPAGGSDAVGSLVCAAARAIIIIYTVSRETK